MCEHCENYNSIWADLDSGMFYNAECKISKEYISSTEEYVYDLVMTDEHFSDYHRWSKRINYCPMCGRKL